ncbi:hypothetical protein J6590_070392 [Homalodisca vitripennis]|nr:hypothetical protein J6590_070392 [Homalodisca vitripennis]
MTVLLHDLFSDPRHMKIKQPHTRYDKCLTPDQTVWSEGLVRDACNHLSGRHRTEVYERLHSKAVIHFINILPNAFTSTRSKLKHSWMFWRRKRYLVTILTLFGFMKVYTLRSSVSVAAVAMTSLYHTTLDNGTVVEAQDFNWDSKMLGTFLSSYFYGQVGSQLLGGWLAARVGGARLFGWALGVTSVMTVITPPIAYANFYLLLITRALTGFFEGVTYPCLLEIWSKWIPSQERLNLMNLAMSGMPIGIVAGLLLGGLIADYLGWAFIFYITVAFLELGFLISSSLYIVDVVITAQSTVTSSG